MTRVLGLATFVDAPDGDRQARQMTVSARLEAVLDDGRRVVLLDDRGWTSSRSDGGDPWEHVTAEELQRDARVVVGPDEPPPSRSHAEEESAHWTALAHLLTERGIEVAGPELASVPHEVHLSDRVRERIDGNRA